MMTPILMNRKDLVEIQPLCDGAPSDIKIDGRIKGASKFQHIRLPKRGDSRLDGALIVLQPWSMDGWDWSFC